MDVATRTVNIYQIAGITQELVQRYDIYVLVLSKDVWVRLSAPARQVWYTAQKSSAVAG